MRPRSYSFNDIAVTCLIPCIGTFVPDVMNDYQWCLVNKGLVVKGTFQSVEAEGVISTAPILISDHINKGHTFSGGDLAGS